MKKLLRKLDKWRLRFDINEPVLTKWQREIIYNFIIDYIKGVKKENGK